MNPTSIPTTVLLQRVCPEDGTTLRMLGAVALDMRC
jgi:hypothetical protein